MPKDFIADKSVWERMKKNLLKGQSLAVKVGGFEESVYGEENEYLPVAQVMQWNEEGSETNPMRPFIRYYISQLEKEGKFIPAISEHLHLVATGKLTWTKLYEIIGKEASEDLKKVVEEWAIPPNSPTTEEIKERNDPLVDTGFMRDSITYKIGRKTDR